MFYAELEAALNRLREAPSAFENSARIYDPRDERTGAGLTDMEAEYAYIRALGNVDVDTWDGVGCSGVTLQASYRLVARMACPINDELATAILARLQASGLSVFSVTLEPWRVYEQEVGGEMPADLHIISMDFRIRKQIDLADCYDRPCCEC